MIFTHIGPNQGHPFKSDQIQARLINVITPPPGVSGSSYFPIGDLNSQCGTGINDAVAAKGTPSAIRALKFYRLATLFYLATTPFRHRKPDSNSPQTLHTSESGLDANADADADEREQEEAQLMLAVVQAQRKVCDLEHQLVGARVEEADLLGDLYRFRMLDAQRKVADANFDIGLIHRDISKNSVQFPSGYKRCRTSSSLHESLTIAPSGS
ncbi:hypothetical protein EV363DRAFT_1458306 [Boletus edulis]|nr:hypothetical protein EV363DRAFT_1458306 [Boletus edulis]